MGEFMKYIHLMTIFIIFLLTSLAYYFHLISYSFFNILCIILGFILYALLSLFLIKKVKQYRFIIALCFVFILVISAIILKRDIISLSILFCKCLMFLGIIFYHQMKSLNVHKL